jgi:hypothetical protein
MNDNMGRDNSSSESDQNQGNTDAGSTSGFFEGIGNAISGIFGNVANANKSADVASEGVTQAPGAPDMNQGMSSSEVAGPPPPAPVVLGSTDSSDTADTSMGADAGGNATPAQEEEPFVGSGGVGSADFYESMRKGHEAAGGEYNSDLEDPNK